jgi:hypothetical protein
MDWLGEEKHKIITNWARKIARGINSSSLKLLRRKVFVTSEKMKFIPASAFISQSLFIASTLGIVESGRKRSKASEGQRNDSTSQIAPAYHSDDDGAWKKKSSKY